MTDTVALATLGYIISGDDRSLVSDDNATEGAVTGSVYVKSGDATNGLAGNAVVQGGSGRDGSGGAELLGGTALGGSDSDGGHAYVKAGNGAGADGDGGNTQVFAGDGTGTGNGGLLDIKAGAATGSAGGGNTRIRSGGAVNGAAGHILIDIGQSTSGADGQLKITGLLDFANDAAAASGGIAVNGVYRNGSVLMIRVA
jgi:hypothetical protein